MAISGAVPLGVRNGIRLPLQLLDAGHHHDDDPPSSRQERTCDSEELPREALFGEIMEKNVRRPPTRR